MAQLVFPDPNRDTGGHTHGTCGCGRWLFDHSCISAFFKTSNEKSSRHFTSHYNNEHTLFFYWWYGAYTYRMGQTFVIHYSFSRGHFYRFWIKQQNPRPKIETNFWLVRALHGTLHYIKRAFIQQLLD